MSDLSSFGMLWAKCPAFELLGGHHQLDTCIDGGSPLLLSQ